MPKVDVGSDQFASFRVRRAKNARLEYGSRAFRLPALGNSTSEGNGKHGRNAPVEELTVPERTPHKSTPLRAAPYFRPDPIHGSPSRSPLRNSSSIFEGLQL